MSKYVFLLIAMLLFVVFAWLEIYPQKAGATESMTTLSACSVDASAAPELTDFSKKVVTLCERNYPKIKNILKSSGFNPPQNVKIIFRKQNNPGETVGNTVYLSIDWFKQHPDDDFGAIVHELAHVVQHYTGNNTPFWLQEGIADFIRYDLGYQNSWSYPHCVAQSPHYTSGYWCSAAFLSFVNKTYKSKKVVNTINGRLRLNTYNDTAFKDLTGKTISQLWQDCLLADCKGGTP